MKLKTIASLFNRNNQLNIYTADNGEQWISNGVAVYSLRGMPHMTADIILRIFDIPPDKRDKWLTEESEIPVTISFEDYVIGETEVKPFKINIEYFGVNYWLFPDGQRVYSFNEEYLKSLLDEPDYLKFHKRTTEGGGFILACKVGLELKAIILPSHLHNKEEYTEEIQLIAKLYAVMSREKIINSASKIFKMATKEANTSEVDEEKDEMLDGQMDLQDMEVN